jgi:hypothetical protein
MVIKERRSSFELSEVERVQLKKSSFELVVFKNWVEFWRWQSKEIEKKWQEKNLAVESRLHVEFEVTVDCYKSVARIRVVQTEEPSACVTEL